MVSDRSEFFKGLTKLYFGANRAGARISEGLLGSCWSQEMLTGLPAAYFSLKVYSETDSTEDLKAFDVPTLMLHGDDDQIAPVENAYKSAKLIADATLKVYPGGPHAIIATHKQQVNDDILTFINAEVPAPLLSA